MSGRHFAPRYGDPRSGVVYNGKYTREHGMDVPERWRVGGRRWPDRPTLRPKNGSADEPMRFIQFWILPSEPGLETRVQQRQYTLDDRTDRWLQIMGPPGTPGLDLAQDARALVAHLTDQSSLTHEFGSGRGGYLYVIDGRVTCNGEPMRTGDAAAITGAAAISLASDVGAELILIDVPLEFSPVGVWAGE